MPKANLDMPSLATQPNWDYVDMVTLTRSPFFGVIENYYAIIDSPTLTIGIRTPKFRQTWKFAGYAYQELIFTPDFTSAFGNRVISDRQYLKLGVQNLIRFESFGNSPYQLRIEFPHWFDEVYLEIFKYVG